MLVITECKGCGAKFTPKHHASKYCCDDCRPAGSYSASYAEALKARRKAKPRACAFCGSSYTKAMGGGNKYCSQKCSSKANNRMFPGDHRKRAQRYGVGYESFNVLKVLERDGWTCQICGVSTPKELRGKNKENSPELDHITPLSKGGDHSQENAQCACRKCNREKRDMYDGDIVKGDFRMIGGKVGPQLPTGVRFMNGRFNLRICRDRVYTYHGSYDTPSEAWSVRQELVKHA